MSISWRQDGHSSNNSCSCRDRAAGTGAGVPWSGHVGREGEAKGVAAETARAGCALPLDPARLGLMWHKMTPLRTDQKASASWWGGSTQLGCESPAFACLWPMKPTPVSTHQLMEGMEPAGWSQQLQQCQLWATGTALNLCCWVSDQGSPLGPIHHTARRNFLSTAHVNNLYTQLGFWKGRHSDMQLPCVTWGQGLQVPLAGLPEVFWFQPRCHAHNEIWWSCHSTVSWHAALFYWLQELPSSAHTLWDVATKALFFPKDLFFDCSSYKITVHKRKSLCTMCKSTQWRAQFCWTHLFFYYSRLFPFFNDFTVHSPGCIQQGIDTMFLELHTELHMDCLAQISVSGVC